jgi:hypothetical protein
MADTKPIEVPKTKVEVAEAIPVALSSGEETYVIPAAGAIETKPLLPPSTMGEIAGGASLKSGWLDVESFPDETSANLLWQRIRATQPSMAAGLRVRTERPVPGPGEQHITLNIGPFPSGGDASNFCHKAVLTLIKNLRCRYQELEPTDTLEAQITEPALLQPVTESYQHAGEYAARRAALRAERRAPIGNPSRATGKGYWLQLAGGASQIDALSSWKTLQANNSDLLGGLRSSVAPAPDGETGYVVRGGPMETDGEAGDLCATLKERGIDCQVYANP